MISNEVEIPPTIDVVETTREGKKIAPRLITLSESTATDDNLS